MRTFTCVALVCATLVAMHLGTAACAPNPRHSFFGPYTGDSLPFWELGAGAELQDSFVRITPDRQSRTGYVWNNIRSIMTDWEVEFSFSVSGLKGYGGDGFALWYTSQRAVIGEVFGSADFWQGLAIVFDTYNNDGQGASPYIFAMENDGTQKYDGSDDGASQALDSCSFPFRNLDAPAIARLRYVERTLTLEFSFPKEVGAEASFVQCLNIENLDLGVDKYFGLTAHTGDVADNHDVHSFRVTDLTPHGVDLSAVRERYRLKLEADQAKPNHEELSVTSFQHSVLTTLHQLQESVNIDNRNIQFLVDASRTQVGRYNRRDGGEDMEAMFTRMEQELQLLRDVIKQRAVGGSASTSAGVAASNNNDEITKLLNGLSSDIRSNSLSIQKSVSDLRSDLSNKHSTVVNTLRSETAECGAGSSGLGWVASIMLLIVTVCVLYLTFLSVQQARQDRRFKLG